MLILQCIPMNYVKVPDYQTKVIGLTHHLKKHKLNIMLFIGSEMLVLHHTLDAVIKTC